MPPSRLDDVLLAHLGTAFPHLLSKEDNYRNLRILNEDEMKSPKGKEAWRNFVLPVRSTSVFGVARYFSSLTPVWLLIDVV